VAAGRRAGATKKPVLSCVMAEPGRPAPLDADGERLPAFAFPENAARALGRASAYAEWRAQPPALYWGFDDTDGDAARGICRAAAERGADWLTDDEVRRVLAAYRLPTARSVMTDSAERAVAAAREIGFPVALKISASTVTHKTDVGGVRLDVPDESSVRQVFADLTAKVPGAHVVVQQMVTGGVETMMGIVQDRLFGPLVAFGLGGIHVEILKDVRVRLAPLTDRDVDDLLHGIRGFPLLQGYRGHAPADVSALRDTLLRLSRLADEVPEIAELDLNPVMALAPGQGCRIVDARIRVEAAAPPFERRRFRNRT
jgi:acyl-CoA synthetase (NDP forming)